MSSTLRTAVNMTDLLTLKSTKINYLTLNFK